MSVAAVVLDNEAVQALLDQHHPKHQRLLDVLTEVTRRNLRRSRRVPIVVPTAVRVESGWDRSDPGVAEANRITRPRDRELTTAAADRAAHLRAATGVSVVDACVAETFESADQPVAVVSSDRDDMARLRAACDASDVRLVRL